MYERRVTLSSLRGRVTAFLLNKYGKIMIRVKQILRLSDRYRKRYSPGVGVVAGEEVRTKTGHGIRVVAGHLFNPGADPVLAKTKRAARILKAYLLQRVLLFFFFFLGYSDRTQAFLQRACERSDRFNNLSYRPITGPFSVLLAVVWRRAQISRRNALPHLSTPTVQKRRRLYKRERNTL